ncbi:MAG: metalloregulator ArsR/SmtB family transcription factor, partial [Micrococcales bacterium]|nr:metalloregulator ArsR/SmtB family transcription factor [Micrococcales bacterium]
ADPETGPRAIDTDAATAMATVLKALADPLRLRMLSFVAASPGQQACVCDLMTLTDLSQPTVSHHLKVLRDVGVLSAQRRGTWVWYSVTPAYHDAARVLLADLLPALDQPSQKGTVHD